MPLPMWCSRCWQGSKDFQGSARSQVKPDWDLKKEVESGLFCMNSCDGRSWALCSNNESIMKDMRIKKQERAVNGVRLHNFTKCKTKIEEENVKL